MKHETTLLIGIFLIIILAEPICEMILSASYMTLCLWFISALSLGMCLMVKKLDPIGGGLWLTLSLFTFGAGYAV